jgi:hypothetical protein
MASAAQATKGSNRNHGQDAPLVPEPQHTGRNAETIGTAGSFNKAAVARAIFNEVGTTQPRKEVIARFKAEAKLTDSGAATYYQNMKKEAGLVAVGGQGNTRAQNNPPEKDGGVATAKK